MNLALEAFIPSRRKKFPDFREALNQLPQCAFLGRLSRKDEGAFKGQLKRHGFPLWDWQEMFLLADLEDPSIRAILRVGEHNVELYDYYEED